MELPTLATARLHLRGFRIDDLDLLCLLYGDPAVMHFLGDGTPLSREVTQEKLAAMVFRWEQLRIPIWLVERESDGAFLGRCGFSPYEPTREIELAYTLLPSAWGQGYATEAAKVCIQYTFDNLKWDRIIARTRPTNVRSRRVIEKLGFQFERDGEDIGGAAVFYGLRRTTFAEGRVR